MPSNRIAADDMNRLVTLLLDYCQIDYANKSHTLIEILPKVDLDLNPADDWEDTFGVSISIFIRDTGDLAVRHIDENCKEGEYWIWEHQYLDPLNTLKELMALLTPIVDSTPTDKELTAISEKFRATIYP